MSFLWNNGLIMKRILFLINDLGVGGAQKVFLNDAKDLEAEGHVVKLITMFRGRDDDRVSENCLLLERSFLGMIKGVPKLRALLKEFAPDVVISTLDEANFLLKLTRFTVWGGKMGFFVREANEADKKALKYKIFDIVTSVCSVNIIAVSEAVKRTLVSYLPWKASQIDVVPNGIVIGSASTAPGSQKTDPGQITVLNVGSLTKKKNHEFLLRSFALAMRELEQAQNAIRHRVKLVIAGQGDELPHLEKVAADLDLSNKVIFLGKVAPDATGSIYANADIFALSSSREGFPNVLLEAMVYSLPVVSTNAGASPEIVDNGKTGFIWHKGDQNSFAQSLVMLILDSDMRKKMGQAGRARLEQLYSQEKHLAKLKEVLGV
jgi:glycosyltransferase involved in cell wall biosynthesis